MGARGEKCEWDEYTINRAAEQGNLEMVKYCVANECPIDEKACAYAAAVISIPILTPEGKAPWDWETAASAASNGHLHILEYLVERKYDQLTKIRVRMQRERPLRLFEVLAKPPKRLGTRTP